MAEEREPQARPSARRESPEELPEDRTDVVKVASIMEDIATHDVFRIWVRRPIAPGVEGRGRIEGEFYRAYVEEALKVLDRRVKRLEASTRSEYELGGFVEDEWPQYASHDFHELVKNAKELEGSVGDASRMLFHAMEMETLLERIERKARATSRKYEARLAASLRDICRIHDPSSFSQEQAESLRGSVTALIEGWGKVTRDKLRYVRTRLLDVGLTWLPITEKALHDLEEERKQQ